MALDPTLFKGDKSLLVDSFKSQCFKYTISVQLTLKGHVYMLRLDVRYAFSHTSLQYNLVQ